MAVLCCGKLIPPPVAGETSDIANQYLSNRRSVRRLDKLTEN